MAKLLKKSILLMLCLMFVFVSVFTGCANNSAKTADSGQLAKAEVKEKGSKEKSDFSQKKLRIAFINPYVAAPYMATFAEAAIEKGKELGAEVVMMDAEANSQKAYDLTLNAINQKFDGIMLLSPDRKSSVSLVKKVLESGIPLIITNARADDSVQKLVPFVGADLEIQGEKIGNAVVEVLGDDGGNVCIIEGPGGHDAAILRSQGFMKVIDQHDNIKVLGVQQSNWDRAKAMAIMEDYLTQFPEIDAVFAHDDNMAIGAIEAIKAAGRLEEIKVFGVGASKDGLAAIKKGEMYATVTQQPELEGALSVEVMIKVINGEDVPEWTKLPCDTVTKENVDNYKGTW